MRVCVSIGARPSVGGRSNWRHNRENNRFPLTNRIRRKTSRRLGRGKIVGKGESNRVCTTFLHIVAYTPLKLIHTRHQTRHRRIKLVGRDDSSTRRSTL